VVTYLQENCMTSTYNTISTARCADLALAQPKHQVPYTIALGNHRSHACLIDWLSSPRDGRNIGAPVVAGMYT